MKKLLLISWTVFAWSVLAAAPLHAQDAEGIEKEESVNEAVDVMSIPDILKEVKYATKVKPKKKAYVYFFVFSHSGCGPCRALVPKCNELYKEMKGKGAELVMLNCGKSEETARNWAKEADMSYPVVTPETAGKVKVPGGGGTPGAVAVTASGEVLDSALGTSACATLIGNWKDLVKETRKADKEKKSAEKKKKAKKKAKKSKKSEDTEPGDDSAPSESDF